jgi:hypothetical protein
MWKTKNFYILAALCGILAVTACNNNKISWIETDSWKKDYKGCAIYRSSLIPVLKDRKQELLGKTDAFFFQVMGKANRVSYSDRGKKIFYYYLTSGSQCDNTSGKTNCLTIEFEALGTSRLVYLEEIQL